MYILCARCGEELTAPKFFNGKPYGYSCYAVVAGKSAKKDKSQYVKVELVESFPDTQRFELIVSYKGKKIQSRYKL